MKYNYCYQFKRSLQMLMKKKQRRSIQSVTRLLLIWFEDGNYYICIICNEKQFRYRVISAKEYILHDLQSRTEKDNTNHHTLWCAQVNDDMLQQVPRITQKRASCYFHYGLECMYILYSITDTLVHKNDSRAIEAPLQHVLCCCCLWPNHLGNDALVVSCILNTTEES